MRDYEELRANCLRRAAYVGYGYGDYMVVFYRGRGCNAGLGMMVDVGGGVVREEDGCCS